MNIDHILSVMNRHGVRYLLVGGVNFLLRHKPILTFDIDFWIEPDETNFSRCEQALSELKAEWGKTEEEWRPVSERSPGWLTGQSVFCLNSPFGAIDIFMSVKGLPDWREANARAEEGTTAAGIPFRALSDADMLACQTDLPDDEQKKERVEYLRRVVDEHERSE